MEDAVTEAPASSGWYPSGANSEVREIASTFFTPWEVPPARVREGKGSDLEISEASVKVTGETETFCGNKVTAGAPGQLSGVGGTKGKVVKVEVPFWAGWLLGGKATAPSRKGQAVAVRVEVPLAIVGATPEVAALSKGNVALVGVRELLRSRLVGSGFA